MRWWWADHTASSESPRRTPPAIGQRPSAARRQDASALRAAGPWWGASAPRRATPTHDPGGSFRCRPRVCSAGQAAYDAHVAWSMWSSTTTAGTPGQAFGPPHPTARLATTSALAEVAPPPGGLGNASVGPGGAQWAWVDHAQKMATSAARTGRTGRTDAHDQEEVRPIGGADGMSRSPRVSGLGPALPFAPLVAQATASRLRLGSAVAVAAGVGRAMWKEEASVVAQPDAQDGADAGDAGDAGDAVPCDSAFTRRRTAEVARVLAARAVTVLEQGAPIERAFHEAVVWYLAGQDCTDLEAHQEALRDDVAGNAWYGDPAAGLDTDLAPWQMTQRQQARTSTWRTIDETLQALRSECSTILG